jgi:hypothetical protein
LSGILERSHAYVTWSATHRAKLALSLVLLGLVAGELAMLAGVLPGAPLRVMVVAVNPVVAFLLSALGLKMTLGRQSLARTSYRPDLSKKPPVDVLAINAVHLGEPPDVVDILREMAR